MIPKVIHYCWFGRGKKPHLIRKCIESWSRVMPDYQIKEWNEDNFPIHEFPFAQEAYNERKWAFVADVCRFYALYNEGGIYLDTDVEVFKTFDTLLANSFFAGTEVRCVNGIDDNITVDASVFGSIKEHWYTKLCLNYYKDKPFRRTDGHVTGGVVQFVATLLLLPYGYKRINATQTVNDIKIYSTEYFANVTTVNRGKDLFSLHHFDGSWNDSPQRGRLFKFCRKHDLMHIYRKLEALKGRL